MNSHQTLIQKLEMAIQNDVAVCNIDKAVDNLYLLNTCDKANRELWDTIEFEFDPDAKDLFLDLSDVKNAVYWKINHPTLSKIIGIYWNKSDVPKMFRAIILPP